MNQIVIIGAGPTGLTLAMLLAKRGINVKLIEASNSFRRIFRGEALMPSGLKAISQMGLSDVVQNIPHRCFDAWEFYIENRPIFRVDEPMELGGQPCMLISQPAFLETVLEKANECEQFEFIQGTAVRDLLWQDDRVSGVKLSDGREIAADLVIGADGRNSIVRQQANLALTQAAQSFDILWFKLPTSPDFTENIFYSILRDRDGFGVFQSSEGNLQVGWSLDRDHPIEWQKIDWAEKLASASPDWLATHFRQQKDFIERPLLLSIVVGRCPQWHVPGLLLLGDAAHPMSPIRAQGINMALRDAIVATNHLVPLLQQQPNLAAIDAVLPQIQAEREPEIIQIQRLQAAEVSQGELMKNNPLLRYAVSFLAPLIGSIIKKSWLDRQLQLRQGVTCVDLKVKQ
ncbi:FAD-dependent monooxygenase [Chamaesiphon sp. VAR_48_metabat_135_sub]|uniref:FAD-dependent monooxygenase n=1 Tax=Chamaesiphon sp. VAR_48_metabat_135_sub TaxID=2964699 RepID=UPI0037C029F2